MCKKVRVLQMRLLQAANMCSDPEDRPQPRWSAKTQSTPAPSTTLKQRCDLYPPDKE